MLDILQDREGYLWLATENGVNRFDGYDIVRYYRAAAIDALPDDFIYRMAEDSSGDLWFATARSGIARWHPRHRQLRVVPARPRRRQQPGLRSNPHAHRRPQRHHLDRHHRRGPEPVRSRHRAPSSITGRTQRPMRACRTITSTRCSEDASGNIWVGTDDGLSRYDADRKRFYRYASKTRGAEAESSNRIRSLAQDDAGTLWVGTFGAGLRKLEPNTGRSKFYSHDPENPESLCHNHIRSVLEDRDRRLWGRHRERSVPARSRKRYVSGVPRGNRRRQAQLDNDILSLLQDDTGVLWVGTRYAGANLWNPAQLGCLGHHYDTEFLNTSISSFATARPTTGSARSARGLMRFERNSGKRTTYKVADGLSDDRVMALNMDTFGGLWIGTMFGGLSLLRPAPANLRTLPRRPTGSDQTAEQGHHEACTAITAISSGSAPSAAALARYDVNTGTFERLPPLVGTQVMSIAQGPVAQHVVRHRERPESMAAGHGPAAALPLQGEHDRFPRRRGRLRPCTWDPSG